MNETRKSLREWLADVYGDESTEAYPFFDQILNDGIRAATLGHRFDALNTQASISVTDGELTLPALCQRVNFICKKITKGNQDGVFMRRTEPVEGDVSRIVSNWYQPNGLKRTAGTIYRGDITKGSSVITRDKRVSGNDWYDSDDVGKLLIIEGHKGQYEITAVDTTVDAETVTVYPSISHESANSINLEVDPMGQKKYLLYTDAGVLYTGDIVVGYQELHPTLINDEDRLVVDCAESVKLYAMGVAYRQGKYDVVSDRLKVDLDKAYRLETSNEANEPDVVLPQGLLGGTSYFEV